MHVDYVRVYQREGETNVGCNPTNYPTTDYINNHINAYTSAFLLRHSLSDSDVYFVSRPELDALDRWADGRRVHETEKQLGTSLHSLFAFLID